MFKGSISENNDCVLILNNGHHFFGKGFGYHGNFFGEICFNTSITGYQEILTDPSYFKQIITFTFPHIGIVGTNKIDIESSKIAVFYSPIGTIGKEFMEIERASFSMNVSG